MTIAGTTTEVGTVPSLGTNPDPRILTYPMVPLVMDPESASFLNPTLVSSGFQDAKKNIKKSYFWLIMILLVGTITKAFAKFCSKQFFLVFFLTD